MSDNLTKDDLRPPVFAPWLAELNTAQVEAVKAGDGPMLVLAGAGTGKTRVLTTRLAFLLASAKAWPSEVLAVTFTNKAAREMRERVAALIGPAVEGLWLGTFHAIAARILRRHAEVVGLKSNFTILDADDQLRLLKQLLKEQNIDEQQWPARALAAVIDRWKDKGLGPDRAPKGENGFAKGRAIELYGLYQERLKSANACDFGDLLLHNLELFKTPHILADYQRRFRYILVDEYQDSNIAQYLWLMLLAQKHRNICCVGDDDQSIYGWRGAEVGNILRFTRDFPGATLIRLERNYRSTPHILAAASALIAHNRDRLGKTLWTELAAGEKVEIRGAWDGDDEARIVAEEIEALQRRGVNLRDIAVLVRAGHQTRAFEERFVTQGLKYRVIGGLRFYEREEIRDALAYFRLIVQEDDDLAFARVLNVPKRGLGEASLQALHTHARAAGISLSAAAASLLDTDELRPKPKDSLKGFLKALARWRSLVPALRHTELAALVLEESGYLAMWQADRAPDAPGRVENLNELIVALEEFEDLAGFVEHVSLVMERERANDADAINLMTLHAAKGLEFEAVFLPGWEEGLFPNPRALEEGGASALEEERRLAHVGITRARRHCCVLLAASRRIFKQWQSEAPSRFIAELPPEHTERFALPGLDTGRGLAEADLSQATQPYWPRWPSARRLKAASEAERNEARNAKPGHEFKVGERVFHQKFGYGLVRAVEDNKLTIAFEKAGEKRVIESFVEPA
jgi:DNA helicase-2/ATP-dependent DNA helicase PcrA